MRSNAYRNLTAPLLTIALAALPASVGTAQQPTADEPLAFASDGGPFEPLGAGPAVTPLADVLLNGDRILLVTEALQELDAPSFRLPAPTPVELVPARPAAPVEQSGLSRPIFTLTLDGSADPALVESMAKLSEDVAIEDLSLAKFGSWSVPQYEASLAPARFAPNEFSWAAPALYTRPLYFEQPNLERYGHHVAVCERDNLTQSAISAAHFFVTVPVLPYKIGAEHPDECSYVLGSYRPGSCNPHQLLKPQLSVEGAALEAAAVTGTVFFLP